MEENISRDSVDSVIPLCSPMPYVESTVHIVASSVKLELDSVELICNAIETSEILVRFFVFEDGLGFIKDDKYQVADQKFVIGSGMGQKISFRVNLDELSYEYSTSLPIVIEASNKGIVEITIVEIRGSYIKVLQQRVIKAGLLFEIRDIFNPPNQDMEERERNCVICMHHIRNTIIEPCCHICLCEKCANLMRTQVNRKCPMCRQGKIYLEVISFIKIKF